MTYHNGRGDEASTVPALRASAGNFFPFSMRRPRVVELPPRLGRPAGWREAVRSLVSLVGRHAARARRASSPLHSREGHLRLESRRVVPARSLARGRSLIRRRQRARCQADAYLPVRNRGGPSGAQDHSITVVPLRSFSFRLPRKRPFLQIQGLVKLLCRSVKAQSATVVSCSDR